MTRSLMDRRALFSTAAAAALLAATGVSASAPKRGGRLRIALSGAKRQDTWTAGDGLFMQVARQGLVFDTLTEVAADGTLRPELATGWTSLGDGRVWRFDLRDRVAFHDGTVMSARDAVASLRIVLDADITVLSADRLEVALPFADPALPLRLSEPQYIIRPAHAMHDGIGTGLYRVKSFEPGQRLVSTRVTDHYKNDYAGWFDEVELAALSEQSVRQQALAGFMVDAVDVSDAGLLADLPDVALLPDRHQPMQALAGEVALPARVGYQRPLDNLRAAERWWFA